MRARATTIKAAFNGGGEEAEDVPRSGGVGSGVGAKKKDVGVRAWLLDSFGHRSWRRENMLSCAARGFLLVTCVFWILCFLIRLLYLAESELLSSIWSISRQLLLRRRFFSLIPEILLWLLSLLISNVTYLMHLIP